MAPRARHNAAMPITPRMFGERGRRRAQSLGIDPDRLPPGQSPTVKWPVLTRRRDADGQRSTSGSCRSTDRCRRRTCSTGRASRTIAGTEWNGDVHCVTRWSKFGMRWQGAPVAELIARARPKPTATHLLAHSYGGYTTNLPLSDVLDHPALIAHRAEGEPLEPDHGGPARLLVPHLYLWKSAKWVHRLELLDHDRAGLLGAQRLPPPRRPMARGAPQRRRLRRPRDAPPGSPGRTLNMAPAALRHPGVELRWYGDLRALPLRVALFQARARVVAHRRGDRFSLTSVTRPGDLRTLLSLAAGAAHVVELGTATGWTAISLALSDPTAHVTSFDPISRPEPARYLRLVGPDVRSRIALVTAPGADGPRDDRPSTCSTSTAHTNGSRRSTRSTPGARRWRPAPRSCSTTTATPITRVCVRPCRSSGSTGMLVGTLFVAAVR